MPQIPPRIAHGRSGIVTAGHPAAAAVGIAVLKAGGNAIDASVAAAAALTVTSPHACSLGGDIYILLYWAKSGEIVGLNGTGRSPAAATPAAYQGGIPRTGIRSVSVPGTMAGWADSLDRFGTISMKRALEPAIELARAGFSIDATLARNSVDRAALLARNPAAQVLFGGLSEGAMLSQRDLAATLERLAERGASGFYHGETADQIAAAGAALGGLLTADDLHAHASLWQRPISVEFRGCEVATMPPNSFGLTLLLQLLQTETDASAGPVETTLGGLAARRRAYAAASRVIGEPDEYEAPARAVLAEAAAGRWSDAGAVESTDRCTTNVVAMDRWGNAVSLVQSVSAPFGAGVVVPGTGILLNNRMTGFTTEPGRANSIGPRRRPAHTLVPCLVLRDGRPWIAIGTPGATGQSCTLAQILRGVLAEGRTLSAAVAEPRWSVDLGGRPIYEADMDSEMSTQLESAEPAFTQKPTGWQTFGSVKAAAVEAGGFVGVADGRREATAAGY